VVSFSLAVVGVCSCLLVFNVTSSPLLLKSRKLPLFICLWFSSKIFELMNHVLLLWLYQNILECHMLYVLSTFFHVWEQELLQTVWHIMNYGISDHLITKSLEFEYMFLLPVSSLVECWHLLHDPWKRFIFQKISLGLSKLVD